MSFASLPATPARPTGLRRLLASRIFVAGAVLTGIVLLMAAVSLVWTPYDITRLVVADRIQSPSSAHWLGTDHLGRDILSMIMLGARTSIAVALVAVGIGVGIGVPLGAYAAARGGLIDEALMRFNDLVFAFPSLVSAIMITAIFGPGAVNAIIAIGIFNIPVFARVARAGALSIWPREFILAARAAGKSDIRITAEHILPNIAGLLLVQASIQFALGILAEAGLSYVGLGAQPPMPSWGRMLYDAQTVMLVAPWLAVFPGTAIMATVLGLNMMGDGIADALDPKARGRR
ncbi:ABC transporter permease [Corticibacterium sp. UT-5YL-CI-8]|nr:ABC transporter permease [Tianweitania sp. UT-5YL-CI-8]